MMNIRSLEQPEWKFHAQSYHQGGRRAYAITMDLETLDSILPTPDPEASTKIVGNNRRFHMNHAKNIANYLDENVGNWVLGNIVLGIDPRYVKFVPYEEGGKPSESLGEFRVSAVGGTSSLEILDGQHRRMAIRLVLKKLEGEIGTGQSDNSFRAKRRVHRDPEAKLDYLKQMSVQVAIYEEPDQKTRARMFAELAKTRNIDAITKARFDDRDPFNRAALKLVDHGLSNLLRGRVEMERSTPPQGSDKLLSLNQLSRCLAILRYGHGSRVSRDRIQESNRDFDEIVDTGIAWADEFLPAARQEYEALDSMELEDGFIAATRADRFAFSVTVLQLLAGCYHEWIRSRRPIGDLAHWIRNADFERESDACIFRQSGMLAEGSPSLVSRRQSVKATIDYIIHHALVAHGD